MQIQDLPYSDPGVPDARSGPRLLWWLWRNQAGGQLKALVWGLLHFVSVAALPFCVGLAVQAVVDRSGTRLALTGGLMLLCGTGVAVGDTFLHRSPSPTGSPPPPASSNCSRARPSTWVRR